MFNNISIYIATFDRVYFKWRSILVHLITIEQNEILIPKSRGWSQKLENNCSLTFVIYLFKISVLLITVCLGAYSWSLTVSCIRSLAAVTGLCVYVCSEHCF